MEISGLGFFNTISAGKHTGLEQTGKIGSFAGIMASAAADKINANSIGLKQTEASFENLIELVEFLQTDDLLELEDGMKLLDMLISDPANLMGKALGHFGLDGEDMKVLIQKWTGEEGSEANTLSTDELVASLANLLNGMVNLPKNELAAKMEPNDFQAVKALKLYVLMSKYADGFDYKTTFPLKESMQNLGEMLTSIIKSSNAGNKAEFIQQRFTQLAAELNMKNTGNSTLSEGYGLVENVSSLKTEGPAGTVSFLPQMARAEQLTLMMNSPDKPVSAEQLMKQFESILSKSQFLNSGGTQKLFIKLFPEHLGSIRVELFQKDQTMMARIITSTGTAKDTLETHINGLKQAFAAQNISVDRIEITQQPQHQERFFNRDPQHQHRQPDRQEQEHEKKEEMGDFNLSFEEALLNMEV